MTWKCYPLRDDHSALATAIEFEVVSTGAYVNSGSDLEEAFETNAFPTGTVASSCFCAIADTADGIAVAAAETFLIAGDEDLAVCVFNAKARNDLAVAIVIGVLDSLENDVHKLCV